VALLAASLFGYGLLRYLKPAPDTPVVTPVAEVAPAPAPVEASDAPPAMEAPPVSPTLDTASVPAPAPELVKPLGPDPSVPVTGGKVVGEAPMIPPPVIQPPSQPIMPVGGGLFPGQGVEKIKALQTQPETLATLRAQDRVAYLKQIVELDQKQLLSLNDFYGALAEYDRQAMQSGIKLSRPLGSYADAAGMGGTTFIPDTLGGTPDTQPQTVEARLKEIEAMASALKAVSQKRTDFLKSLSSAQLAKIDPYVKAGTF